MASATPRSSVLRRVSLDLIRSVRPPTDPKFRRDSDASTSDTIISDPSSCSTLTSPMTLSGDDSRAQLESTIPGESTRLGTNDRVELSPMERSISQPPLSPSTNGALRRAAERAVCQSFDLRMFASPLENVEAEKEHDGIKARVGMMNRLSGMWTRR
ncbi:hypothetical protein BCR41DRAFT_376053 [Lobosporangium transversale]|uniref:Uncharacterized protein n=1 Tax=Lobosporangium transversale TaxID=64571 RepID=A0A1Y2G4Y8_9FUNG|nr:hypothetical protein BCR41DRAFT_376053 [Lobosporangium transversale]ORY93654.1 hypothetical protein BCR41DRAFT_376053 [Lobosporangium transversale]|eukprot:XP_021875149.1 hypothetical protein BCR41DRAFT_376053 [Lobosporangium transversale]